MVSERSRARRDDERGIAVIWMTIVVFLLLGICAVAVDLVHGYLESQKAQNAADAAALAGVVYLPAQPANATSTALDVARSNGFENGVDRVVVTATQVAETPSKLKVEVKRTFDTFFARAIGFDTLTVRESSTADYSPPVALGSPENSFGYQPYRGVWGAINGYCTSREDGDLRASRYHSNRPRSDGARTVCPESGNTGPATLSDDYDSAGYSYIVEVKQPPSSAVALQVFDGPYRQNGCLPGICPDGASFLGGAGIPDITTTFEVWNLNNVVNQTDDTMIGARTFGTQLNTAPGFNQWDTVAMLPSTAGVYRVKVSTLAGQPNSAGSNGFALGARVGGTPGGTTAALPRCVNDANEAPSAGLLYSASCPHIYAEREMSIYANNSDSTAEFYLAEVGRVNAGRTLQITLFDAGEGGQTLEVLDPSGTPQSFTWKTVDDWPALPGGTTSSLNIAQKVAHLTPNHSSDWMFSDRKLVLEIKLPSSYNPTSTAWWKLRYRFGGGVTDRTTWAAKIIGDPVRLVG
jgi:Flp pilus assembly protein TadG